MSDRKLIDTNCLVCCELFRPPVLTLPCQHSFCEICLAVASSPEKVKCPVCNILHPVGDGELSGFTGNQYIEKEVLEIRLKNESVGCNEKNSLFKMRGYELSRLNALASAYKEEEKLQEAAHVLIKVINRESHTNATYAMYQLLKCLFKTDSSQKIISTTSELLNRLSSENSISRHLPPSKIDEIYCYCVEVLKSYKEMRLICDLLNHRIILAKNEFDGPERLRQYRSVAYQIVTVSKYLSRNKGEDEIPLFYPFMDKILDDLHEFKDVCADYNAITMCTILRFFGGCYLYAKSYFRTVQARQLAINVMKKCFGKDAKKYSAVGHCYFDNGLVFACLKRKKEARVAFNKALDSFSKAIDFDADESKEDIITTVQLTLEGLYSDNDEA